MPPVMHCRFLFLVLGVVLVGSLPLRMARAQDDPARPVLPDLAPREVEIRGQLEISLPSLRRQPLVGFNPPPRVPSIPEDRRPWVDAYKQTGEDLPPSPLRRPDPPDALAGNTYPPASGALSAWAGRYFSRGAGLRMTAPVGENLVFNVRADYEGTDGFRPFDDDPDTRTPSDGVEGALGVRTHGTRWSTGLEGGGSYASYTLYGAEPGPDPDLLDAPVRKGGGGYGAFDVRSIGAEAEAIDVEARLEYGLTRYQTRRFLNAAQNESLLIRQQQRFRADGRLRVPFEWGEAWSDGEVHKLGLGPDFDDVTAGDFGVGGQRDGRNYRVRVGGRFMGSAVNDDELPTFLQRIGRVSPELLLAFTPAGGVRLYAQNTPGVVARSLDELYRLNPYLITQPETRASLRWLDAEAGAQVYAGPVKIGVRGGIRRIREHVFFEEVTSRALADGYRGGLFVTRYADAEVVHAGGDLSAVLPGGLHGVVSVTYRDGRLTARDTFIPYFSPVIGSASISYVFARSRGLAQLTGNYEGFRPVDQEKTLSLSPFVGLDARLAYRLASHVGLLLRLDDVRFGYNEQWAGYRRPSAVFGAGVQIDW